MEIYRGKYIYRHYRCGNHCTYRLLHDENDVRETVTATLPDEARHHPDLHDGEEIEIIVRKTGRKISAVWELAGAHRYCPTENPNGEGCPQCREQE